ncbi:hypothetical protein [Brevundimonas faecalis]|uniref:MarR family transcriptional regulator n=1 Tax=Brevundimonas faecalis TaxID=947378 RepID=A0ABV2RAX0_9CAUL
MSDPCIRARPAGAFVLDGYRPGGRWERILRAANQPMTQGEILRAVETGRHSRNVEKIKVHKALAAMRRLGLIARLDQPRGFIATAHGVRTLDAGGSAPNLSEGRP